MINPDVKAHLEWLKKEVAGTPSVRVYLDRRIRDLTEKLKDGTVVPDAPETESRA